jgi:hypothetical protein
MSEQGLATVDTGVPALADDTLIQVAERAEKRIEAVNKIKQLALRVTNSHDWVDQGGKPYLQSSGGEKVARLFGISWNISEPVLEAEEGGHFSYTYTGHFSLSGATIEAVGTRSSKDGFFKKYGPKDENGDKTTLPPSEIDKGDVKKSAYTNLIGNGITRLLGIRNLTWEDLEVAGITKGNVGRVDYKKNGKRTDKNIQSEDSQAVIAEVRDVRKQTGTNKKTGKPWTKFIIKTDDAEYGTFSETSGQFAKESIGVCPVKIVYKTTSFGNDLEAIMLPEDEEPPAPTEE